MEEVDLYAGTKVIKRFSVDLFDGGATLWCEIGERWEEILARTIKCGSQYKHRLKSCRGISQTERVDLESTVKGTFGLTSIASLEGTIAAKAGVEVQLNYSSEVEDEYTFDAPKCGRRVLKLYQQQRLYDLEFEDRRVFHRTKWKGMFVSWLNRIHDASRTVENDPDCGCKPMSDDDKEPDGRFYISIGSTTLVTHFKEQDGQLYLPGLKARLPRSFSWNSDFKVNLQRRMIPDYLLFLMRAEGEVVFESQFSLLEAGERVAERFTNPHEENAFVGV